MKGFKFKLQSVLEARQKKLEDCQLEFAKVKNLLFQAKNKLEFFHNNLERISTDLEVILNSGKLDSTTIFSHQNYIGKLKEDILNQNKVVKTLESELDEKNKKMLEALKEKTMIEKLREKALAEFKSNIEKQDLAQIDELATSRYKYARG